MDDQFDIETCIQDLVRAQVAYWRKEGENPFEDCDESDFAEGLCDSVIEHEVVAAIAQEVTRRIKKELAP